MERFEKAFATLFGILFFLTPLIFWPFTSEVFEFNKMNFVYVVTTLVVGVWISRMIYEGKIIFRRTLLDIPLLVFLGSQILATFFSIDIRTSVFGYYSRFNGGLFSTICYLLLYWAYVSNINIEKTKKIILILIASATITSSIGFLEHYGVNLNCVPIQVYKIQTDSEFRSKYESLNSSDKTRFLFSTNCWVQDVKYRVFSTLGQPNWLATFIVAVIPLVWSVLAKSKFKSKGFFILSLVSFLLFSVLLFTKSRSGLLGFIVADIFFWGYLFIRKRKEVVPQFLFHNSTFLVLAVLIGIQFGPNLKTLINKPSIDTGISQQAPVLEVGGTESGTIRKIVWKGAIELWKRYPIFGSGVETFAYSYYLVRPIEHNLVSEWDFIYNKAHNEYLNLAANTGTLGIVSYLVFIGAFLYSFVKTKDDENILLKTGLMAGFISILVSNFFGFSVVATQIELFLFPALFASLSSSKLENSKKKKNLETMQKILSFLPFLIVVLVLFHIGRYWYTDILFSKGREFNRINNPVKAYPYLLSATQISPNEALYHLDLATSYTDIAVALSDTEQKENMEQFITLAIEESQKALDLSPSNVNIKRTVFTMYVKFSVIDAKYLGNAGQTLQEALIQSPTNAKLLYNLGLIYARSGQLDQSLKTIEKTIEVKPNYKEARLAYALLLMDKKENGKAKEQLEYILKNIDPEDSITKQTLEELK